MGGNTTVDWPLDGAAPVAFAMFSLFEVILVTEGEGEVLGVRREGERNGL